jgi:iron(III) transport system substrate-binding protein
MTLSRRKSSRRLGDAAWAVSFLVLFVTPFAIGSRPPIRSDQLTASDAKPCLELRVITPHNQEIRHVFELAFSDWHAEHFGRPVCTRYLNPGGSNDVVRYLNGLYGGYRNGSGALLEESVVNTGLDVVWGGGAYAFDQQFRPFLKPLALDPAVLRAAFPEPTLAGVPLLDQPQGSDQPRWVGVALSSFGIVHSPALYAALGLPAPGHWEDLARPELSGLVTLADPTRSGAAAVIYMMVLQRAMADGEERWLRDNPEQSRLTAKELEKLPSYRDALALGFKTGMRTLLRLAANARYFTDSGSRPSDDVGLGEAAAGVAIDFYARVFQDEVGRERLEYLAPRGATAIVPDPVGVLYGSLGERELLANRFVEFLLSAEGQRLWNLKAGQAPYVARSLRRLPARRDVYANRAGWSDDENPFESASGFNLRQGWMRWLNDLLPVWAAAWIDGSAELKASYATILALPPGDVREQLLAKLSDLPFDFAELEQHRLARDARKAHPAPGSDERLLAAEERLRWAERFRGHYLDTQRLALRASRPLDGSSQ